MSRSPRVTLGVPVYNGERYLAEALTALAQQDFEDIEIIVSDNASTDASEEICRAWVARDRRFRYERQTHNRGGQWNVNHLVDLARGREFKWAYCDDLCAPSFVSECVKALDVAGPDAVMAHTRVLTIDEDSKVIEERDDSDLRLDSATAHERLYWFLKKLANQAEFGLIRTAALRRTAGVQPYIGSELLVVSELCMQGKLVGVPGQLLMLRRHDEQFGRDRYSEANWYLGSGQPQSVLPFTKINMLLLRTVARSGLSPSDKAACAGAVLRGWTLPHWRSVASDLRHLPESIRRRRLVDGARPS